MTRTTNNWAVMVVCVLIQVTNTLYVMTATSKHSDMIAHDSVHIKCHY